MNARLHNSMKKARHLTFCFLLGALTALSQTDIPIGSWRLHLSYHDIRTLAVSDTHVYAASKGGVIVYNLAERSLHTFNKLNGLSSTGISALAFDEKHQVLLIGYEDGTLDVIEDNTVTNFYRLRESDITAPKKIKAIFVNDGLAYLTTAYGVVVFDILQQLIKETWRDLGPSGEPLAVNEIAFLNDSIFLATARGLMVGSTDDNLLDFNNWKRYDTGELSGNIRTLSVFAGDLYVSGTTGVYRYHEGTWQMPLLQSIEVESLTASENNLFIIGDSTIYTFDRNAAVSEISDPLIQAPAEVRQDNSGNLWIGDRAAGLLSNASGTFQAYRPNGPSQTSAFRLIFDAGRLFAVAGGFSASGQPLGWPGYVDVFENGAWSTISQPLNDLTDIAFMDNQMYVSSFAGGIVVNDATGGTSVIDENNSPLSGPGSAAPQVTALHVSPDGLWVAVYEGNEPLYLLKKDGTWQSYSFNFPNADKPIDIIVSRAGDVWMALQPFSGGGLIAYEEETGQPFFKSNATGQGALAHKNVNSLAIDREGYVWVGTDAGVAYFFSPQEEAIKPVFENRFLLRDEKITAIEVDGGNRKWLGTERGVWLFNDAGDALIHHFTADNSPLPSDNIRDMEINPSTGELFISTDRGVASYRSDATHASDQFEAVRIFPNPVHPGYAGMVGISGLANDAVVKITDIRGKLLWHSVANGGTASWNVRDVNGTRVPTGVYLVFAIAQDGRESIVGKVAVIE